MLVTAVVALANEVGYWGVGLAEEKGMGGDGSGNYVDCSVLYLFHIDFCLLQKTVLSNLIQEIEPLDVSVIQKDIPPATVDAMKRTISGMLGLLPSDQFQVSIEALWEPLSKLLISSMMTGYTLRNAECRLCLERNLDTDEGFVSRPKTEDSQLEAEGMLVNNRMNKTSGNDESLESETRDRENGVPGLGQIPPEAEKYILNLQSRLSSAKRVINSPFNYIPTTNFLRVKGKAQLFRVQMQQFVGEEQNDLLDYLRSLQPEKVAELSEPTSPALKETIHSVVHGLLATLSPKMHSKAPTLSESTSTGIVNLGFEEDCIDLVENTSLPFHPQISLTRDYLARLLFWCMLLGHHLRGLEYRSELMELLALTGDVENDAFGGEQNVDALGTKPPAMLHLFHLKSRSNFTCQFALHHLTHLHCFSSKPSCPKFSNLLQGHISNSHLFQIHAHILRANAHQDNLTATRLIGHYPPKLALRVFHQLQKPNIFPFNAIIRVLAEEGLCSTAFSIFKELKLRSLFPNDLTFSFLLKAWSRAKHPHYVDQIHTHVLKNGFIGNPFVCNGLLAVYAKGLKDLVSARKVFDEMPDKGGVYCWTSLIAGYAQSCLSEDVLKLFLLMVKEGLRPEDDTMVSVLSACSNLDIVKVEIWVRISSKFLDDFDSEKSGRDSVNTVLVYLFGKWGKIDKSREIFDVVSDEGKTSVLAWNAMIGAYVQNGCASEALSLFRAMMEDSRCSPNHVTLVFVFSACAQVGDLCLGMRVHEYTKTRGRKGLGVNRNLCTALIDMYSKCGSLEKAREVFDQMVTKDVVSFNAMIMGLAINGDGEEALSLFFDMQELGLHPNAGTLVGVLCACNHSGLLMRGRQIFSDMSQDFSVAPNLDHYACYVDLLARVGCVEEAIEVVTSMPFKPNAFVWGALLGGCLLHNRLELTRHISNMLVDADPENSGGYVMLSNAFAVDRRWSDVSVLRGHMRTRGVRKQPGRSWISIDGILHEFLAGSPSHPYIKTIYYTLDILVKQMRLADH
ncbi:hypothetical protein RJ639_011637 [Escallonia herrerae]|uniref:Pentatricopeptide repeat-containing protein n=1 Tax=Escallonia herrerae TaxID=1293975 RepID=A0AA88VN99_9ASTE|nr:hypothetical protein RJ639_011637 [Escallonia herrerae]